MNARTQITMSPEMQQRARAKAAELGISLAEYVRRLVADDLGQQRAPVDISELLDLSTPAEPKAHISEIFDLVKDGPVTDIARDKDALIGDAIWEDYLESVGRKPRRR